MGQKIHGRFPDQRGHIFFREYADSGDRHRFGRQNDLGHRSEPTGPDIQRPVKHGTEYKCVAVGKIALPKRHPAPVVGHRISAGALADGINKRNGVPVLISDPESPILCKSRQGARQKKQ